MGLLLCAFFSSSNHSTYADSDVQGNSAASSVYGQMPDLGTVRSVSVGGHEIRALPMRVGNLDILSPITSSLAFLGASASQVNPSNLPRGTSRSQQNEFFQLNIAGQRPIILQIGKAVAYVDGKSKPLLAAPLLMKGQIWLPVFSIAPLLGASARVAPDGTLYINPTVQSVRVFNVKGTLTVTISTSAPIPEGKVLMGTTDNPPKIYFDFQGFSMGFDANNSTDQQTVSDGKDEIDQVRAGLFQSFPDTTRVVLDLNKPMQASVQPMPDKTLFAVLLVSPGTTAATVSNVDDAPTGNGSLNGMTIVVDAGHGGKDSGAPGQHSLEKDHALDISKRLKRYLQNMGAKVLMTRDDDTFISLEGRVSFANSHKADIFVSCHLNSYNNPKASGTGTYYYTSQSKNLANEVQRSLDAASGLPNRGVNQARFYVIRNTTMPSILTESCFISNPQEEALVMQPSYRDKLAKGIAQGIANYVKKYR
jgi:N-acetylmuramoyl-L-alanine amidase CwlD